MAFSGSRPDPKPRMQQYVRKDFPLRIYLISFLVTVSYNQPPSINFPLMIARYIRQFTRTDPKEAIQYVYCICLSADQGNDIGREQLEAAWDLCRKVIVASESSGGWEDLIGGIRRDGVKFVSLLPPFSFMLS